MAKVLISDKLSPQAVEVFKHAGIETDVKTGLSKDELLAIIGNYDGLAIRSATKVTKDVIEAAKNLKVIGRAGIGVDNVDTPAATAKGIVVMNTPFGNSVTTAEHAITMMMSLARNIPQANATTKSGVWEKTKYMGVELAGKTLGLIGCGNIGSIVADRALGLKMKVIAYDPFLSAERAQAMHVEKVELDAIYAKADFITLHTPLNDQTRHMIDAKAMAKMKKGVRIINCARGGLIVEEDLKKAVESGQVAGAALDVFEEEPLTKSPLFEVENVIVTPHLGASTNEAQENVAIQVAEQMSAFLNSGSITNAVNMPSVSSEDASKLKPYFQLADQLGSFAGQLTETGLKSVTIEYEGQVAKLNTKPLTAIVLKGLLHSLVEGVNMVNAPVIAEQRGIKVSATQHEQTGDYQTLIKVTVTTEKRERSVSGTLFSGHPRVVEVHGIKLEATLGPRMLYVNNEDKPGLIGNLGKLLGDAGVNIANFHLGRNDAGNDALSLLQVDQPISSELLAAIAKLPSVKQAKVLVF